jgi:transcriptional regulator with XRE-family HTH domain
MASIRRKGSRIDIAERLRRARIEQGLTIKDAATKLRVQHEVWRRLEVGIQSIPAERVADICNITKLEPLYLLGLRS